MRVLFSPIGTADPMSILGDGPMLHIVRHYQPDVVSLFLSPSMAGYERDDHRYTRAIGMLCAKTGQKAPEVRTIISERDDVHHFDGYIKDFKVALDDLLSSCFRKHLSDDDKMLVNVSSGTPAMEQALVALGAFGWIDLTLLQVTTPNNGTNSAGDRENPKQYDLDALWEINPDNEGDRPNRVEVVHQPHFKDELLRDNVIALVKHYDYAAALELADQMADFPDSARSHIAACAERLNMDREYKRGTKADEIMRDYVAMLEVRKSQGHWADFVRALTPAITETMKRVLRPYLPEGAYLKLEKGTYGNTYGNTLDVGKVKANKRLMDIKKVHDLVNTSPTYLTNRVLLCIVKEYCDDKDHAAVSKVQELVEFERGFRNRFAHTILPANKDKIESDGNLSFDGVLERLIELNPGTEPGRYDKINHSIIALIQKE